MLQAPVGIPSLQVASQRSSWPLIPPRWLLPASARQDAACANVGEMMANRAYEGLAPLRSARRATVSVVRDESNAAEYDTG